MGFLYDDGYLLERWRMYVERWKKKQKSGRYLPEFVKRMFLPTLMFLLITCRQTFEWILLIEQKMKLPSCGFGDYLLHGTARNVNHQNTVSWNWNRRQPDSLTSAIKLICRWHAVPIHFWSSVSHFEKNPKRLRKLDAGVDLEIKQEVPKRTQWEESWENKTNEKMDAFK